MATRPEIERALRYVAEHLEQPITLETVARAARLSPYHLHRLFHEAVGEPLGRFVTRRRLEQAALCLAYEPDRSITEVALSSGYSSSSNFSKAFSRHFGCSPSQVRRPEAPLPGPVSELAERAGKSMRPNELYVALPELEPDARRSEAAALQSRVRFVTTPAIDFACLAGAGGYRLEAVEATWSELIDRARQLGLCEDEVDAWGLAHDSPVLTDPSQCRYHACVPMRARDVLPPPLFRGRLGAGRYAVFSYAGEVSGLERTYRAIYSCWFPESSVAPDDFSPYDHYIHDGPRDGQIDMEIWFKVRPRR